MKLLREARTLKAKAVIGIYALGAFGLLLVLLTTPSASSFS